VNWNNFQVNWWKGPEFVSKFFGKEFEENFGRLMVRFDEFLGSINGEMGCRESVGSGNPVLGFRGTN
jgi:hypothetical protein